MCWCLAVLHVRIGEFGWFYLSWLACDGGFRRCLALILSLLSHFPSTYDAHHWYVSVCRSFFWIQIDMPVILEYSRHVTPSSSISWTLQDRILDRSGLPIAYSQGVVVVGPVLGVAGVYIASSHTFRPILGVYSVSACARTAHECESPSQRHLQASKP
jgi:hypothetical protein